MGLFFTDFIQSELTVSLFKRSFIFHLPFIVTNKKYTFIGDIYYGFSVKIYRSRIIIDYGLGNRNTKVFNISYKKFLIYSKKYNSKECYRIKAELFYKTFLFRRVFYKVTFYKDCELKFESTFTRLSDTVKFIKDFKPSDNFVNNIEFKFE